MSNSPDRGASFWTKAAPGYARKPLKDPGANEALLVRVSEPIPDGARVLEIGCGTGLNALKLARMNPSWSILATDYSAGMIEVANERIVDGSPSNLSFSCGDALEATSNQAGLNAVLAFSVIHLVVDLEPLLKSIHANLEPGGLFAMVTPCLGDMAWYIRPLVRAGAALRLIPPVALLNRTGLIDSLERAGFEIVTPPEVGVDAPLFVARKQVQTGC